MAAVVSTSDGARGLAEEILDPTRTTPILAVSVAAGRPQPLVDVARLEDEVGPAASVHVLSTEAATWELKRRLPPGLDVFGDAIRIWSPGVGVTEDDRHPLLLLREGPDPEELVTQVADLLGTGEHREHGAVVVSVSPEGALLRLPDGTTVAVPAHEVTRHALPVTRVLRPAQRVRALVLTDASSEHPATGSLLPLEPDPLRRLVDAYGVGATLLGRRLDHPRHDGRIELLPGVTGRLRHDGRGAPPRGAVPAGHREDDLVAVTITAIDTGVPLDGIELVVADDDGRVKAASLHPDGPPWLTREPVATELPLLGLADDDAWGPGSVHAPPSGPAVESADGSAVELQDLSELLERSARAHARSRAVVGDLDRTVEEMRATAAQMRHELELDLVDLRDRVLHTLEAEHDHLRGTLQEALTEARDEIRRLRALLAESSSTRQALEDRVGDLTRNEERHRQQLRAAEASADRQRAKVRQLQRELDSYVPLADRIRAAVRASWLRNTVKGDRERYPWREPTIGPQFVASLDELEGIGFERVADVCAEVVSGRAAQRHGLQVHALRQTSGGGSGQRVREDGARAYRASLQVRSAAARRLHYWELPDGGIELAKIGYHDDFTIS
ncbi:hypothetical protein [Nocardioides lijunqiniae]|uniref:hypothetical protein n=1 Tax=Nocardioides lijunqiniae TaxID=2760832 RepID=UPI0018786406|nr:hypothetical protein [Nocardioides lijunqiniae]